jgi:hypothetical protein
LLWFRNARQHPLGELRKLDELLAVAPLRYAAETIHALRNIGLEADSPLLAVIGAVDADLGFPREHVRDPRIRELVQPGPVHRLAQLLVDQHGPERLAARNAAGVRRQDTVDTALHRGLSSPAFVSPRLQRSDAERDRLVVRFRSSPLLAARSDASFGIKGPLATLWF